MWALASICAISLKLVIFWFSRKTIKIASGGMTVAILALFLMNSFELLGLFFVNKASHPLALFGVQCYYLFVTVFLFSIISMSFSLTTKNMRPVYYVLAVIFVLASVAIFWPKLTVANVHSLGYGLTRTAGSHYYLVQIALVGSVVVAVSHMLYQSFRRINYELQRAARSLLVSFSPMFMAIAFVVCLMAFGVGINGTIVFSLCSILSTLLLIKNATRHGQISILRLIPRTRENQLVKRITQIISNPEIGLENSKAMMEKPLIEQSIALCNGNKSEAALLLGISRATLYRKLKQHGLIDDE